MPKILILLLLFSNCSGEITKKNFEIFFRLNQIGFDVQSEKSIVALSNQSLTGERFLIYDAVGDIVVFSEFIKASKGKYGKIPFSYSLDFSSLETEGKYYIKIDDKQSDTFEIKTNLYSNFNSYLLEFFKIQRCGYTNPKFHTVCHVSDIAHKIENDEETDFKQDATGGWHDAGDYTKFLNTTAFSTYMLLFTYEFNKEQNSFDNDSNGVPDILEEAKIGLDWLLRANVNNEKFITQIQNEKDQQVGWRLPEKDPVGFDRPGFLGIGKNLIGIYVAALSLGSRIWKDELKYETYADKLLNTAVKFYQLSDSVPNIDSSGTGFYIDNCYKGKLALGEIELYLTTGKSEYLESSKKNILDVGTEAWWGWGNVGNLAFYKISKINPEFTEFLEKALIQFEEQSKKNIFDEGIKFYWGSTMNLLGIPLINILYKDLTKSNKYDELASKNIDYLFGKNPWGISFIYGKGKNYSKNLHHQVGYFNNKQYVGAIAGGPVMKTVYGDLEIKYEIKDKYIRFQTDEAYYRDDRHDYVTNEPTISANATGIFVFGNIKKSVTK